MRKVGALSYQPGAEAGSAQQYQRRQPVTLKVLENGIHAPSSVCKAASGSLLIVGTRSSEINPLYAIVAAVDDMNTAPAIHSECPGTTEASRLSAWSTPRSQRYAIKRELLHEIGRAHV